MIVGPVRVYAHEHGAVESGSNSLETLVFSGWLLLKQGPAALPRLYSIENWGVDDDFSTIDNAKFKQYGCLAEDLGR